MGNDHHSRLLVPIHSLLREPLRPFQGPAPRWVRQRHSGFWPELSWPLFCLRTMRRGIRPLYLRDRRLLIAQRPAFASALSVLVTFICPILTFSIVVICGNRFWNTMPNFGESYLYPHFVVYFLTDEYRSFISVSSKLMHLKNVLSRTEDCITIRPRFSH